MKNSFPRGRGRSHWLGHLLLFVFSALLLLPVFITFFYALFPRGEILPYLQKRGNYDAAAFMPGLLLPKALSLQQYYTLFIEDQTYLFLFMNTVFYSAAILGGQAFFITTLSFALSRFRFRGRDALSFLILTLMVLPFQVTMVPNVLALRSMDLLNSVWAVILPNWFAPFYIFLLRQYMLGLPGELYEAGMMDSAGAWRLFLSVTLPICKPMLAAAAVLSLADQWNMVEQPLAYLRERSMMPLSIMFGQMSAERADIVFAGAALCILPMLLIYLYFQEDVVSGLQLTELK